MLDVSIIHAPRSSERSANVERLRASIPGARVVEDRDSGELRIGDRRGCWPVARRAWADAVPSSASHRLVLEDDAVLCARFLELAEQACDRRPDAAITFFWGDRGCSVATALPASIVERWLGWADVGALWVPHHDILLRAGCRVLGVPYLHTEPSLVEHGDFASLLGHGPTRALRFDPSPDTFDLTR